MGYGCKVGVGGRSPLVHSNNNMLALLACAALVADH